MLIWIAVMAVVVFLDQLTKYHTVLHLDYQETYPIIQDVFHFTRVHNTGSAFGMFKNARWVFMITSTLAIIGILAYMIHRVYMKKEKIPFVEALSLSLIVGGGIGNMIDRTVLGYVVDMIDCRFINFAVFNVADSFVCIGAGIMIVYLLRITALEYRAEKAAKRALTEGEETPAEAEKADTADVPTAGEASAEAALVEDASTEAEIPGTEDSIEDSTEGADHE